MAKCKIVFDTNILRQSDFTKVANTSKFVRNNLSEGVAELVVAEISELEWKKAKREAIENNLRTAVSALKNLREVGYKETQIEDKDIGQLVDLLFDKKREEIRFSTIPIPQIEQSELVRRAVQKKIPFEQGKGDSGFKDTILLLSLIQDARESGIRLYVMVTEDKDFDGAEQEFHEHTGAELVISRESTLNDLLDEKLEIGLKLAEKRRNIESIIEESKNEFEIFLLKRGRSGIFSHSNTVDGYTFRSFGMQEFWPQDKDIFRVNGIISANIVYKRSSILPISPGGVIGLSSYKNIGSIGDLPETSILGVPSSEGVVISYSPWQKTEENFFASLEVNTSSRKVSILD